MAAGRSFWWMSASRTNTRSTGSGIPAAAAGAVGGAHAPNSPPRTTSSCTARRACAARRLWPSAPGRFHAAQPDGAASTPGRPRSIRPCRATQFASRPFAAQEAPHETRGHRCRIELDPSDDRAGAPRPLLRDHLQGQGHGSPRRGHVPPRATFHRGAAARALSVLERFARGSSRPSRWTTRWAWPRARCARRPTAWNSCGRCGAAPDSGSIVSPGRRRRAWWGWPWARWRRFIAGAGLSWTSAAAPPNWRGWSSRSRASSTA